MEEKKQDIRGVEYTFKKLSSREWARLRDRSKNQRTGHLIEEKFMDEVLEHVVIDPKVKMDDIDFALAEEIVNAAASFCIGRTE